MTMPVFPESFPKMKNYCEESVFKKPMKKSNQHHPPTHNLGKKSPQFGKSFAQRMAAGKKRKMAMANGRSGVGKHRVSP